MNLPGKPIRYREVTPADVPGIMHSRSRDPDWGPADPRTGAYLAGDHHPQRALPPRTGFLALQDDGVVGYIAGHLTRRFECDGELQYLWVAPDYRKQGIASRLLELQAEWFLGQDAGRICVDVLPDNTAARSFYGRNGAETLNPHWLVWPDIRKWLADKV